ncbi:MAG: YdeI/OmpD-associated family protein [Candidatus Saccharimonadales bacterium]
MKILFSAKLYQLKDWIILRIPKDASDKLPSRGQIMAAGTINGVQFRSPLEPDGQWGHWFAVEKALLDKAGAKVGDTVKVELSAIKDWDEPEVPADLLKALKANKKAKALWDNVTPLSHWEWIRQIRGTNSVQTRQRRIEVACSKLAAGKRRPCCWNRNACSQPSISKNGVLLGP